MADDPGFGRTLFGSGFANLLSQASD